MGLRRFKPHIEFIREARLLEDAPFDALEAAHAQIFPHVAGVFLDRDLVIPHVP